MSIKKFSLKNYGNSFMEYALVLGIISLVLTGMNIYIKRGMQAKVKDMTDYFFKSQEQAVDTSPNVTIVSQSNTITNASVDTQDFTGGGRLTTLANTTTMEATSSTEETGAPYIEKSFVPAEAGEVNIPGSAGSQVGAASGASATTGSN